MVESVQAIQGAAEIERHPVSRALLRLLEDVRETKQQFVPGNECSDCEGSQHPERDSEDVETIEQLLREVPGKEAHLVQRVCRRSR